MHIQTEVQKGGCSFNLGLGTVTTLQEQTQHKAVSSKKALRQMI